MEIQGLLCLKKKCVPVLMRKRTNLKYVEHELQREKKKRIRFYNMGDMYI